MSKASPGQFEAERELAGEVLKHLRAASVALDKLTRGRGGEFLLNVTIGGEKFLTQVHDGPAGMLRWLWESPMLAKVIETVRRTRVKSVCAGCKGARCAACRHAGFVPEDASLLAVGDGAAFDFGNPWDDAA